MIERIKNILFQPKQEWEKIKAEQTTVGQVLTGYAVPLALIPAVCGMIGFALIGQRFGVGAISGVFRIPFVYALIWAIVSWVLSLLGYYIQSLIINALAPSFGSKQDAVNAFKLVVYSATPAFIAGILNLIPYLGILVLLLSLYSIYILYLGFPVMMETPSEKVIGYIVVTIIIMVVLYVVIGAVAGAVLAMAWRPMF